MYAVLFLHQKDFIHADPALAKEQRQLVFPAFREAYRYRTLYDLVVGSVKGRRLLQDAVDKNGNRQLRKRIFSGMHFKII